MDAQFLVAEAGAVSESCRSRSSNTLPGTDFLAMASSDRQKQCPKDQIKVSCYDEKLVEHESI